MKLSLVVSMVTQCTVGDSGVIANFSYMSIVSPAFVLPALVSSVHTLHTSDLDLPSTSIPFLCKNYFCSLKTEGVTNIFFTKNIFSLTNDL